ncbi:MAG: hypothetical protein JSW64_14970, partial [Candidatus Zixiibacteriota bacterium]
MLKTVTQVSETSEQTKLFVGSIRTFITFFLFAILIFSGCDQTETDLSTADPSSMIAVPDGNGLPVLIDGMLTEGEWDDALQISVRDNVKLYFKKFGGHLFISIPCKNMTTPVVDLFFAPNDSIIYQLHVSAQLAEKRLNPNTSDEDDPRLRGGFTEGWYANELRWDVQRENHLIESEGIDRSEALARAMYPTDAIEYQILQTKFNVDRLKFRAEVAWAPDYDSPTVFPEGT